MTQLISTARLAIVSFMLVALTPFLRMNPAIQASKPATGAGGYERYKVSESGGSLFFFGLPNRYIYPYERGPEKTTTPCPDTLREGVLVS